MHELDQGYKAPKLIEEQDYATTYKLTGIAPFYRNMQKEQTTALFLVF